MGSENFDNYTPNGMQRRISKNNAIRVDFNVYLYNQRSLKPESIDNTNKKPQQTVEKDLHKTKGNINKQQANDVDIHIGMPLKPNQQIDLYMRTHDLSKKQGQKDIFNDKSINSGRHATEVHNTKPKSTK